MKDLSILLPEPLDVSDSDRRYSSMKGLLVAPDGKVRDPAGSRFSFKMLRFAWIIGTVDVELEVDGRTVRSVAKGEAFLRGGFLTAHKRGVGKARRISLV